MLSGKREVVCPEDFFFFLMENLLITTELTLETPSINAKYLCP